MSHDRKLAQEMIDAELSRHWPQTQEDCCALAARISLALGAWPATDTEFIDAGLGAARGLFGEAFEAADDAQRWAWIDMCERALRDAAADWRTTNAQ
jgi:hypothetical protein